MLVVLELKTWLMDHLKTNDNMCFHLKKYKKIIHLKKWSRLPQVVLINQKMMKLSQEGVKWENWQKSLVLIF